MYAHQVIEDLKYLEKLRKRSGFDDKMYEFHSKLLLNGIINSVKFNIHDVKSVYSMFSKDIGTTLFLGPESKYQKMPFGKIWMDWLRDDDEILDGNDIKILKRGILAHELYNNLIAVFVFNYLDDKKILSQHNINKNCWIPPFYGSMFSIGCSFGDNKYCVEFMDKYKLEKGKWMDGNTNFFQLSKLIPNTFDYRKAMADDGGDITVLSSVLKLLNCKNISTEKYYPSEKLNRNRKILGKQPLFTYHTLVVNPMSDKKRSDGPHEPTGIKQRLHFCRGHFKEYTESNKLFGKHTGLYWWQPMVRGNKELGIVHKDYQVKVA